MSLQVNSTGMAFAWDGQSLTVGGTPGVSTAGVTFTIIVWFKALSNASGSDFVILYTEGITTDTSCAQIGLKQSGAVSAFYRPAGNPTTSVTLLSGTGFDNFQWHWAAFIRYGTTDHRLFVDGIQRAADQSTTVSTTYLSGTDRVVASGNPANGGQTLVNGSRIGPVITIPRSVSSAEARTIAYSVVTRPQNLRFLAGMPGSRSPASDDLGHTVNTSHGTPVTVRDDPWQRSAMPAPQTSAIDEIAALTTV